MALALLAIGEGIYLLLPRAPKLTQEQFDRIQIGMTQAEVEAVLGCPPGNYTQGASFVSTGLPRRYSPSRLLSPDDAKEWAADMPESPVPDEGGKVQQNALGILVWLDRDGRVIDKSCVPIAYFPPTLLERLRARVGW